MDPLTISALVSGGVGLVSAFGQHRANVKTEKSSQHQMDFQREMSNTSYRRAMHDMKEAGLNPILAYSQGGASSPAGTSYQHQDSIGKGAGSALEARRVAKEVEALSSQKAVNASLVEYQAAQAQQAVSAAALNRQNTEVAKWNAAIARNDALRKDVDPRVLASKAAQGFMASKYPALISNSGKNLVANIKKSYNAPVVRNPSPTVQEMFSSFKRGVSKRRQAYIDSHKR